MTHARFRPLPSQAEIAARLDYDPETGILVWKNGMKAFRPLAGTIAGGKRNSGYVFVGFGHYGATVAHRLIWILRYGAIPLGFGIDHIDGDGGNNRLSNLRLATDSQQRHNSRVQRNNKSGLKGAYYHAAHKGKKWRTQIKVKDRLIFLGYYHTAEEAHAAYLVAASEHFGAFHPTDAGRMRETGSGAVFGAGGFTVSGPAARHGEASDKPQDMVEPTGRG